MEKIRRRIKNRKGFTLVEIIVVIVIIAILLAALTPAVIGWIREARDRAMMAEGRTGLVAAQAILTEVAGTNNPGSGFNITLNGGSFNSRWNSGGLYNGLIKPDNKFAYLIGNTIPVGNYTEIRSNASGELIAISYTPGGGSGRTATWLAGTGSWTVTETFAARPTP